MKILIAPLDWGLGHATRCIPVIKYLLEKKCEVIIGADGRSLQRLQKEFPSLEFVKMPGYDISYTKNGEPSAAQGRFHCGRLCERPAHRRPSRISGSLGGLTNSE